MVDRLRSELSGLSTAELRTAVEGLRGVLRESEFALATAPSDRAGDPGFCPHCGCVGRVVRKGHVADGSQRWLCKECGRTFGARTGRVLSSSKLPEAAWMEFAECFVLRLPLRECAERCGVCLKTAFYMRHRMLEVVARYVPPFMVGAGTGAELDETFFPESFKGNHSRGAFELPRPARRRGRSVRKRGLSKEQICVASGVNDSGGAFLEVVGRGVLTKAEAARALAGRVGEGAIVSTDRAHAYRGVLASLGVAEHRAYSSTDRSEGTINQVNALHSSLALFMARFRGVSTKHLQGYLSWFAWDRAYGKGGAEACARQLAGGPCSCRWSDFVGRPAPLMGYWEQMAAEAA